MDKDISFIARKLSEEKQLESYVEKNCKRENKYFYQYLAEKTTEKGISMSSVISNSKINKNYVYNIVNGRKLNPSRDKVIALCIGGQLNVYETCTSLEMAGYSRLRPENERDLRLAVLIDNAVGDVFKVNIYLAEYNLQPLKI